MAHAAWRRVEDAVSITVVPDHVCAYKNLPGVNPRVWIPVKAKGAEVASEIKLSQARSDLCAMAFLMRFNFSMS